MALHYKLRVSLGVSLLLTMQLISLVHCFAEAEPAPSIPEEPSSPSTGGGGGEEEEGPVGTTSGSGSSEEYFGYIPFSHQNSLGQPVFNDACDLTLLQINAPEFDKRCGPKSDPKWPCFSHNGESGMQTVTVEPWSAPLNMTGEILLQNDKAVAFTLRNASDEFTILYQDAHGAMFKYYGYEPDTGCYKIHLSGTDHGRIHVTTTDENYRDIDTWRYRETGKRLCNKWIYIGTRWRDTIKDLEDDDGRGI